MSTSTTAARANVHSELSPTRLRLLRVGYLLIGVGLVLVKWPLLPDAASLPLYEGVTLCMLTAMSLGVSRPALPSQAAARVAVRVSLEAPLARTGCASESRRG
jgi:hypothetical protein